MSTRTSWLNASLAAAADPGSHGVVAAGAIGAAAPWVEPMSPSDSPQRVTGTVRRGLDADCSDKDALVVRRHISVFNVGLLVCVVSLRVQ